MELWHEIQAPGYSGSDVMRCNRPNVHVCMCHTLT